MSCFGWLPQTAVQLKTRGEQVDIDRYLKMKPKCNPNPPKKNGGLGKTRWCGVCFCFNNTVFSLIRA